MGALSSNQPIYQVGDYASLIQVGVDGAASVIYESAMVTALTATGYAVKAGTGSAGPVLGVAKFQVDNSTGSDGDLSVDLLQGLFWRPNNTGITQAHFGCVVYAANDQDVTATKSTNPVAGICCGVDATQGVLVLIHAGINRALDGSTLASVASGFGASLIGVQDAANNFSGATVEAVLAEIMTLLAGVTSVTGANLVGFDDSGNKTTAATVGNALDEIYVDALSTQGYVDIPLTSWGDADGDVVKFANGTTDGLTIADSKAVALRFNNSANPPKIISGFVVPFDADITANMTLSAIVSKSGATIGDATTLVFEAFNQVSGLLHDADVDYGGTTGAVVGDAAAKTTTTLTRTLTAANLPCRWIACIAHHEADRRHLGD